MTTSRQLTQWMRYDPTFLGVFPRNTLPPMNTASSFIVNTHSDNLSGQHWIAVRVAANEAWIFDPLAYPPDTYLCNHIMKYCHNIHVTKIPTQQRNTQTCGMHCVYFLYTLSPASSEQMVKSFVSKL
jgi:hypothetical protein